MNKWIASGRLTKEPEIRYTGDSKAIVKFNLAVDRKYKSDTQSVDFFNCTAFGKTAETIEKYVGKGTKILVDGEIRQESYEKDGRRVYTTEVIVNSFEFCESKSNGAVKGSAISGVADEGGFMMIPEGLEEELPFN